MKSSLGRLSLILEMAYDELRNKANQNGELWVQSWDEAAEIVKQIKGPLSLKKSPIDIIDDQTGEFYVEKGKEFVKTNIWRDLHGVKKSEADEALDWDIDEDPESDEVFISSHIPAEFVDDFEAKYDVKMIFLADDVDDPDGMRDGGYDIDVYVPEEIRRMDGKMFTQNDVDNINEYVKVKPTAHYSPNIKLQALPKVDALYAGVDVLFY